MFDLAGMLLVSALFGNVRRNDRASVASPGVESRVSEKSATGGAYLLG